MRFNDKCRNLNKNINLINCNKLIKHQSHQSFINLNISNNYARYENYTNYSNKFDRPKKFEQIFSNSITNYKKYFNKNYQGDKSTLKKVNVYEIKDQSDKNPKINFNTYNNLNNINKLHNEIKIRSNQKNENENVKVYSKPIILKDNYNLNPVFKYNPRKLKYNDNHRP